MLPSIWKTIVRPFQWKQSVSGINLFHKLFNSTHRSCRAGWGLKTGQLGGILHEEAVVNTVRNKCCITTQCMLSVNLNIGTQRFTSFLPFSAKFSSLMSLLCMLCKLCMPMFPPSPSTALYYVSGVLYFKGITAKQF